MQNIILTLRQSRAGLILAAFFSALLLKLVGYLPELSWWLVTSPLTVAFSTALTVAVLRKIQSEWRNA